MSIDVNVQNDLVVVTESSEDIVVNVSNAAGPAGAAGVGVPVGGSTGQVLKKLSATNYDTYWALDAGGVPYSGATGDVDLGEYELKAGQVEFDQTPTGAIGAAVMRWNDSDGTVDLGLKGGNVTLQVGQEQVLRVVNKTGVNLLESQYRAVRIRLVSEGGSQGQRLAVVLAQGDNDPDSTTTIGIVTENIDNNQEGFITTSGEVRGINTTGSLQGETWVDGDIIYLSPTIPGGITKVKPIAPNHLLQLGYVIYAHAVNGKIFVKIDNGYELSELHDVFAPSPTDGQGIFWNTANLRYQNNTVAGILGYTPLSGSGATGQVAYWNGTNSQTGSNNLFWDAAKNNLGIGTNSVNSAWKLGISGNLQISGFLSFGATNIGSSNAYIEVTASEVSLYAGTSRALSLWSNGAVRGTFSTAGNLSIGSSVDGGQRLQVYGDAFVKGSGSTSATNALLVQNSAGTQQMIMNNAGNAMFGNNALSGTNVKLETDGVFRAWTQIEIGQFGSVVINISQLSKTASGSDFFQFTNNASHTAISGTYYFLQLRNTVAPTSGAAIVNGLNLNFTINQTGGANGITRGLYVNPTLTAAADWRSVEWSNNSGWGLYGAGTAPNYLNGSLGIGTTPIYPLDVAGAGRIQGNAFFSSNVGIGSTGVTNTRLRIGGTISGSASSYVIFSDASVGSSVTGDASYVNISPALNSSTTLASLRGFVVNNPFFNAGSSATLVTSFYGDIANAAGRWNLYMNGTADNYLAGKLLINTTTVGTFNLDVNGTARVSGDLTLATSAAKIIGTSSGNILVISNSLGNRSVVINQDGGIILDRSSVTAPSFVSGSTDFTGSSISSSGSSGIVIFDGGTGDMTLKSGTNRNLILNAGQGIGGNRAVVISSTNPTTGTSYSAKLVIESTTQGFLPPRMTTTQKNAIVTPAAGLQVYDTTLNQMSYYNGTTWVNF